MEKRSEQTAREAESALECLPGYFTVKEAARILGVSDRSVYGYVDAGKLPGARVGNVILVSAEHTRTYERKTPGRVRAKTPLWHQPLLKNPQYLTVIKVRVRPGQSELLERKLHEMRAERKHLIPGTAARYIARGQSDPDEVMIVLVWRRVAMPPEEEREASLAAFYADLAEALDWETAVRREHRVLLHA